MIALGGSAVMDAAKVAPLCVRRRRSSSLLTNLATENKVGVVDPCILADIAIVDPTLTDGLPPRSRRPRAWTRSCMQLRLSSPGWPSLRNRSLDLELVEKPPRRGRPLSLTTRVFLAVCRAGVNKGLILWIGAKVDSLKSSRTLYYGNYHRCAKPS